jgi:hypothetical protein
LWQIYSTQKIYIKAVKGNKVSIPSPTMILKRKAISRKYKMELTRLKANHMTWCKYCNYFEESKDDGRNKCTREYVKEYQTISIFSICMKLIPVDIGSKLRNYVYVVPKRKED